MANPPAGANNNNNYQAPALPGVVANPTPGTIVVHINARVTTQLQMNWGSQDTHFATAPAGSTGGPPITVTVPAGGGTVTIPPTPAATILGNNGTGTAKLAPYALDNWVASLFGCRRDGDERPALRRGDRDCGENFSGQIGSNASSGASGYTCLETIYVRRAFTYVAGEQWGIVRVGQADGIIGIFDNGVTTNQFLNNNFNGGDTAEPAGRQRRRSSSWRWPATSTATPRWSISRRRSPASISASSGRRTPRTASASATTAAGL